MNIKEFVQSIKDGNKPDRLDPEIEALWIERSGNWQEAHEIVQSLETVEAFRVHAYLHRREGDLGNAQYWYKRAGIKMPEIPLDEEWNRIARSFLENRDS